MTQNNFQLNLPIMMKSLFRARQFSRGIHKDVVIMGGGIVGGALLKGLRTSPFTSSLDVALIDPQHKVLPIRSPESPLKDLRTSAISPFSKKLFEKFGVWEKMAPVASIFNEMKVWDDIGGSNIEFYDKELGYMVENSSMVVCR